MKTILVTGATSGFGKAIATRFAKEGNNIIITGRRMDRLKNLKSELEANYGVEILAHCFDVRNKEDVFKCIESIPLEWKNIDVLINNAGLASGIDKIQEGDIEDWDKMIDTNVKGLLYVSKAVIPLLIKNKSGHIINIASTAFRLKQI